MYFKSELSPFEKNSSSIKLEASLEVQDHKIKLVYTIVAGARNILISKPSFEHHRLIGLWSSTCFEFFIKSPDSSSYCEFNFSTEGHWNCFFFKEPGVQLKEYKSMQRPEIKTNNNPDRFSMSIEIELKNLPSTLCIKESIEFSLTTVIEDKHNKLSYWALKHMDKAPNFHNFKSFQKADMNISR